MEPILQAAARIAVRNTIEATAVAVSYEHDGETLQGTIAIDKVGFGEMVAEAEGLDGRAVRIINSDARDLIVWPDDLVLDPGGGPQWVEPENADKVTVTFFDGSTEVFEVAAFPPEPGWRWTDRFQTARRIHLKRLP